MTRSASEATDVDDEGVPGNPASGARRGYRRSVGSPRGEARRQELLDRVTDDLAANGLVDFSLRRAARAAGTTHKVLLYHFDGADDLLTQAIIALRGRRIDKALAAATEGADRDGRSRTGYASCGRSSSLRKQRVLDQAIGLAMYDPDRYADLGRGASQQYLPTLLSVCPQDWSDRRKLEVAEMILACFAASWSTRGPAATWRATTPVSRPWSAHSSGKRPPTSSRPSAQPRSSETDWTGCEPRGSLL